MFTQQDIKAEFERLDRICGVNSSGIKIVISKRAKKRLGCFSYGPGREPTVSISAVVLSDEKRFLETVRHEYAHALVWMRHPYERHTHDAVWKAACREVGCTPRATVKRAEAAQQPAKYIIRCSVCGAETRYVKAGKNVQRMKAGLSRMLVCTKCGNRQLKLFIVK